MDEFKETVKVHKSSKALFIFEIIIIFLFAISAVYGITYGINTEDLMMLAGVGGLTSTGGILGVKDILFKVREYFDYKNAPKTLEALADKLKASASVAGTDADLKVVDAKTQCLYNGYIAYVNKRDIKSTLEACGIYI